jgi:hypothetical protein
VRATSTGSLAVLVTKFTKPPMPSPSWLADRVLLTSIDFHAIGPHRMQFDRACPSFGRRYVRAIDRWLTASRAADAPSIVLRVSSILLLTVQ